MSDELDIAIDENNVTRFFFWLRFWFIIPKFGPRWARLQAQRISYRISAGILYADSGLVWFQRKAIPLRKITDVNLFQDPVSRLFGLWHLRIQTAGSQWPRAILSGVADASRVRDQLLQKITCANGTD